MYRRILVGTDNSVAARSTVEFAADLARSVGAQLHVVAGDPAVRLNHLAVELGADLVIVGSGHVTRRRRHFSSVAVSVVRTAMVPVLVVPTISDTNELDER